MGMIRKSGFGILASHSKFVACAYRGCFETEGPLCGEFESENADTEYHEVDEVVRRNQHRRLPDEAVDFLMASSSDSLPNKRPGTESVFIPGHVVYLPRIMNLLETVCSVPGPYRARYGKFSRHKASSKPSEDHTP